MLALGTSPAVASVAVSVAPDPVEGVPTQIGVSGTLPDSEDVYLDVKPAGATGCGANYDADDGTGVINSFASAGPFTQSRNYTFDSAGSYLLCGWTQTSSTTVTAQDAKTIAVRVPHLSLAISAPPTVSADQTFQVSTTTQAEATRTLYLSALVDTGRGCPANAAAARSTSTSDIIGGDDVTGGPTTDTRNATLQAPGTYLLCGYLQYQDSSLPPEATAVATVKVAAPCVVPAVVARERLAATKARLATASCSAGAVRYVASSRYPRGTVFRLSPSAGTTLANGAAVTVYVSSGPPCVVPRIPANRSLASFKRRLAASHCTVGRVTDRRSATRRRGTVVAVSPVSGRRLSPRAKVAIVVSSGRSSRA